MRGALVVAAFFCAALPAAASHNPVDVALSVDAPAYVASDGRLTYTLHIDGSFPGSAYAVVDMLPPSVRYISGGGNGWSCLQSGSKITCGIEVLEATTSSFTIVADAPPAIQTLTNSATLHPLSHADPTLENNSVTSTTRMYDAPTCAARAITLVAPRDREVVRDAHVTFAWTAVPNATKYDVYAAEGASVLALIATTNELRVEHDFAIGEVQWYVEATTSDCPPLAASPQRFTIDTSSPGNRRRAARH